MLALTIDFANLLLAALVVGALFGVSLLLNPARLDASSYITVQQQAIRSLNTVLPALGAATILVTIAAAVRGWIRHVAGGSPVVLQTVQQVAYLRFVTLPLSGQAQYGIGGANTARVQ